MHLLCWGIFYKVFVYVGKLYNLRMNLRQCFLPLCAFFLPNHQLQSASVAEPVAGEIVSPPLLCTVSSSIFSLRASSVEERPGEDSADPDWDEEVEDRKERGDDDPEYDPETKQKARLLK